MRNLSRFTLLLVLAASLPARATVFATVQGVVHDPQHRPIADAAVTLRAADSSFTLRATTDTEGAFELPQTPIGAYRLQVSANGFATVDEIIVIASGTNPVVHVALPVASATESVVVDGATAQVDSVTPTTLVSREMIEETPGASRATSFAAITDYVPGAYMCHDMLHMRGGHQTSWLIDGVNIPNTNIAANVGPQISPADTDQIEVQRGSYAADIGDRTYGVFNVVPRNGFERDREAELRVTGGNFYTGETALSAGDHSQRTAWYASLAAARSNYGLETPIAPVVHDATNSQSGFGSFLVNPNAKNQFRFNGQLRQDFFQVPVDPNQSDWLTQLYNSSGLRDGQTERDGFLIADWVHTLSPTSIFEIAPFYHWNVANYDSKLATDLPTATTFHPTSNYAGLQASVRGEVKRNNLAATFYSFYQHDSSLFGVVFNDSLAPTIHETDTATGGNVEGSFSDSYRVTDWLTLLAGVRLSSFHGANTENYADPRFGAAFIIPRMNWVLRGFYGRYYQAPPLASVNGPLLAYANLNNTGFIGLSGERDEEHEFSIQIPYRGWALEVDNFKTRINNFLDHSNIGESNVFIPITVDGALVRAWEATLRSPSLWRRGQFHLAYSNQIAEQRGPITGGLICTENCDVSPGYSPVDHDQRHTLNTGFTATLPMRSWFSSNVYYGSGFSNGTKGPDANGDIVSPYQGNYLPVHTTFDASAGKALGENFKLAVTVINVTNHRVLTDSSLTIGGFHYNDPRQVSAELRYRFHF